MNKKSFYPTSIQQLSYVKTDGSEVVLDIPEGKALV